MASREAGKEVAGLSTEVVYKIEVPANRYDLLCLEGLVLSLRVFLGLSTFPTFSISNLNNVETRAEVHPSVNEVRPYLLCAILRNITFTEETLKGFIELQDKLHNNICRKRSLVSMGTHDFDTVKGPFRYEARNSKEFKFRALNRTEENTGEELLQIYKVVNLFT
jgi:phenylalanyl-tRNA synthetase beta chain